MIAMATVKSFVSELFVTSPRSIWMCQWWEDVVLQTHTEHDWIETFVYLKTPFSTCVINFDL